MSNNFTIHSGTSIADADRIFSEMYRITLSLFRLKPSEFICTKDKHYRWFDLADCWTKWANDVGNFSPFEMALHHIYWGVYPDYTPKNFVEFLSLIENELLSDGQAYNAWKKHRGYEFAFTYVVSKSNFYTTNRSTPVSKAFLKYLDARFRFNVVYKSTPPSTVSTAGTPIRDLTATKDYKKADAEYHGYVAAIHLLIPSSKNWAEDQWLNEQHLFYKLKKLYKIDFNQNIQMFDCLISALIDKLYTKKSTYLAQLLKIDYLPNAMVQKIWAVQTDCELKTLFLQAVRRTKRSETKLRNSTISKPRVYAYDILLNSWLYKYVYASLANKVCTDKFDQKVKTKLFEAGMHI